METKMTELETIILSRLLQAAIGGRSFSIEWTKNKTILIQSNSCRDDTIILSISREEFIRQSLEMK